MKKIIVLLMCCMLTMLAACGAKTEAETEYGVHTEAIPESNATGSITQDQALEAIKQYCFANNPDLEEMAGSDEYTIFWDVTTNDAGEIVVLYRSYTGAEIRYYIDPESGDAHTTELVPGIIDEEQPSDETLNVRDYM